MNAFYNEIDAGCCSWLSNLMDAGLITPGVICDKSIEEICPKSLLPYDRVHMFAGIGGWELALQIAGWGNARIWTGSCPCQPFSAAGKGAGFDDQRHLWPAWFHLIRECAPAVIVGEQVASPDALRWLDLVSVDLESQDYAVAAADLCSAGVGGAHIRQRLYWMAHAASDDKHNRGRQSRSSGPMPDRGRGAAGERMGRRPVDGSLQQHGQARGRQQVAGDAERGGAVVGLGNSSVPGLERRSGSAGRGDQWATGSAGVDSPCIWIPCADGVSRPASAEPGAFPLAAGLSRELVRGQPALAAMARGASRNRVVRLRGYGNAIDPRVAAQFLMAAMEAMTETGRAQVKAAAQKIYARESVRAALPVAVLP